MKISLLSIGQKVKVYHHGEGWLDGKIVGLSAKELNGYYDEVVIRPVSPFPLDYVKPIKMRLDNFKRSLYSFEVRGLWQSNGTSFGDFWCFPNSKKYIDHINKLKEVGTQIHLKNPDADTSKNNLVKVNNKFKDLPHDNNEKQKQNNLTKETILLSKILSQPAVYYKMNNLWKSIAPRPVFDKEKMKWYLDFPFGRTRLSRLGIAFYLTKEDKNEG